MRHDWYGDCLPLAYHDPLRWSTKKSFELTLAEVQAENENFSRAINVIEYVGNAKKNSYKAFSLQEFKRLHGVEAESEATGAREHLDKEGRCVQGLSTEAIAADEPSPDDTPLPDSFASKDLTQVQYIYIYICIYIYIYILCFLFVNPARVL